MFKGRSLGLYKGTYDIHGRNLSGRMREDIIPCFLDEVSIDLFELDYELRIVRIAGPLPRPAWSNYLHLGPLLLYMVSGGATMEQCCDPSHGSSPRWII